MGNCELNREERIKRARHQRKFINALHHKRDKERKRIESDMLNKSCTQGLSLIKPEREKKEIVSPPRKITLNRKAEDWNAVLRMAHR